MNLEKTILEYAYKNPDLMGEVLRDYCFIGKGTGCYSNFSLRPEFIELPNNNEFAKEIADYLDAENPNVIHIYKSVVDDIETVVAWDWSEGDGVLLFIYDNKMLINTDCKKSRGWKFMNKDDSDI